jgi:hypothetical protein
MDTTRRTFIQSMTATAVAAAIPAVHGGERVEANGQAKMQISYRGFGSLIVKRDPKRPIAATQSKRAYFVLASSSEHPRHYPLLQIAPQFVKSSSVDGRLRDPISGVTTAKLLTWDIRDYSIRIDGEVSNAGVEVASSPLPDAATTCPTTEEDWSNVNWLGNLETSGASGPIDIRCLELDPPGVVGARAVITSGKLRALLPRADYSVQAWAMKTDKDKPQIGQTRVISDSVLAELDVKAGVKLLLTPFKSALAEPFEITLQLPAGEKQIVVALRNPASSDHPGTTPVSVPHFKSYFDLVREDHRPNPRPFPVPAGHCLKGVAAKLNLAVDDTGFCPKGLCFLPPDAELPPLV